MRRIDDVSQKSKGKTIIAHISDLHFEENTPEKDWVWQAQTYRLRYDAVSTKNQRRGNRGASLKE